jgi:hypothetical protein
MFHQAARHQPIARQYGAGPNHVLDSLAGHCAQAWSTQGKFFYSLYREPHFAGIVRVQSERSVLGAEGRGDGTMCQVTPPLD